MSLPDEWVEACSKSEDRLKDRTPLDPINVAFCVEEQCPAAQAVTMPTPYGMNTVVWCMFSKCIKRYPTKKEMKFFK